MMTRAVDLLTLLTLFGALTNAYRARYKLLPTLGGLLLCLAGAQGQILLEEKIQTLHFLLYILSFIVWGFVYANFFVRGLFREKCVMVIVYVSSFFFITDISFYLRTLLFPDSSLSIHLLRIAGVVFSGFFLYRNAIHSSRKVPPILWASIIAVTTLYLTVYYAMHHSGSMGLEETNAFISLLLLAGMMITFFLCSGMIHYYENGIRRVALRQSEEAEKGMVRESMRLNRELRAYRHEVNNHVATIAALLEQGDVQSVQNMLGEMQKSASAPAGGIHTGNPVADAILSQKKAEAEQKHIPMEIDACLDSNLPLKDTELSSLLTNLLNNAIEGSRQVEDPRIWVHIYPTRAYLCVSIQNRADVTALKNNPLLTTTKQNPDLHGFGLTVVRDIADRYSGNAEFQVDQESGRFIAQVMLLVNA